MTIHEKIHLSFELEKSHQYLVPAPTCGMANRLNCNIPMIENRRFSQSLQLSPSQCATHFPEPTNVDRESAQPRPPVPAAAPFTVGSTEKHFIKTSGIVNFVHQCTYRVTHQVAAYILLTSIWGVPLACLGSS